MTRERVEELLPILQAFAEGKTIQSRKKGMDQHGWLEEYNFCDDSTMEYRIKPEPLEFYVVTGPAVRQVFASNELELARAFRARNLQFLPKILKVREVESLT